MSIDLKLKNLVAKGLPGSLCLPLLLGIYVLVWTCTQRLVAMNLDGYADMLENYAWGQAFDWGSFKHPPLVGWVAGFWFRLFPTDDALYFLLSYVAAALGLLGVYRLAVVTGLGRLATAAVLLQMFAFPYGTLAAKLNANTVLLPLWPWVVYAWWICVHKPQPSPSQPLVLGVTAAVALLGKYFSGVLLLALALLTLALPQARQWLRTSGPWLSLFVLMVLLVPHLAWLGSHEIVTLRYLGEQGSGGVDWSHLLRFAAAPLLYWGLSLAVCVIWFRGGPVPWWRRIVLAWRPSGWDDTLFWVAMLPYGLTLLFGLSGVVSLSLPWAIPIGFAFPLLWLRNLSQLDSGHANVRQLPLRKTFSMLVLLVIGGGLAEGTRVSLQGAEIAYLPRREAARELLSQWDELHPARRPAWVGGVWAENAALAFYGDETIRVIPGLPDEFPARLDREFAARWPHEPGLIYCPPMVRSYDVQRECETQAARWLESQGMPVRRIEFEAHREGWRFPMTQPFRYTGFIVLPESR